MSFIMCVFFHSKLEPTTLNPKPISCTYIHPLCVVIRIKKKENTHEKEEEERKNQKLT